MIVNRKLTTYNHRRAGPPGLATLVPVVLLMALLFSTAGCGGDDVSTDTTATAGMLVPQQPIAAPEQQPGEPLAAEQESPYGSGLTTDQTVGAIIDGVQLLNVRWADHGSYFRIVFDMGTSEGEPMLQAPHAETSLEEDGKQLRVLLGGIRSISDNPNAQAEEITVDDQLVTSIRRVPYQDDQALLYIIDLSHPATYALAGLGSPGRIVIDIIKS